VQEVNKLKNPVGTWATHVKGGHCIGVDDFLLPRILSKLALTLTLAMIIGN